MGIIREKVLNRWLLVITILFLFYSFCFPLGNIDGGESKVGNDCDQSTAFITNYDGTFSVAASTDPATQINLLVMESGVAVKSVGPSASPSLTFSVPNCLSHSYTVKVCKNTADTYTYSYSLSGSYPNDSDSPSVDISIDSSTSDVYSNVLSHSGICSSTDAESGVQNLSVTTKKDSDTTYASFKSWSFSPTVKDSGSQTFTFNYATSIPSTKFNFKCLSKDKAGNASSEVYRNLIIDRVKPTLSINYGTGKSPANGTFFSSPDVTIYFTPADDFSGTDESKVYLNGVLDATSPGDGLTYDPIDDLEIGQNIIRIDSTDKCGNAATSVSITYNYDPPPSIVLNNPSVSPTTVYSQTFTVSGYATKNDGSAISNISMSVNNIAVNPAITFDSSGNFSKEITLKRGTNNIIITATNQHFTGIATSSSIIWKKKWTVIGYFDGDNNLSSSVNAGEDLLKSAGSSENVDIAVLYDNKGSANSRVDIIQPSGTSAISYTGNNLTLFGLPASEVNMSSSSVLTTFANNIIDKYPSDHYCLIINDHGTGWRDSGGSSNHWTLEDDTSGASGEYMTYSDFTGAFGVIKSHLGETQKIDVVALDMCLMGLIETAYAIKDSANYLISSQDTMSTNGLPYDTIIPYLNNTSYRDDPNNFASAFITCFKNASSTTTDMTLSAIDLSKIDNLRTNISYLADHILLSRYSNGDFCAVSNDIYNSINYAKINGKHFANIFYLDIYNFTSILSTNLHDNHSSLPETVNLQAECATIQENISDTILDNYPDKNVSPAGLSIYIPDYYFDYNSDYENLIFAKNLDNSWKDFIKKDITPPLVTGHTFDTTSITSAGGTVTFHCESNKNCQIQVQLVLDNDVTNAKMLLPFTSGYSNAWDITWYANDNLNNLVQNSDKWKLMIKLRDSSENLYTDFSGSNGPKHYYLTDPINVNIPRADINVSINIANATTSIFVKDAIFNAYLLTDFGRINVIPPIAISNKKSFTDVPVGIYNTSISKPSGYASILYLSNSTSALHVISNPNPDYVVNNFKPYQPSEVGYSEIDSDEDGITDGWEYKYWIDPSWQSTCGLNLSLSDSSADADQLYISAGSNSHSGDGLTNLDEYNLYKQGYDVNPLKKDQIVELNYLTSSTLPSSQSLTQFLLNAEGKDKTVKLFEAAGIHIIWSSTGHAITSLQKPQLFNNSISYDTLKTLLQNDKSAHLSPNPYGGVDYDKIIHVICAPGWSSITGLTNISQSGTAGLYINDGIKGIYIFYLHKANLNSYDGNVLDCRNPVNSSTELDKYEGLVLGHEIGHADILLDTVSSPLTDIMHADQLISLDTNSAQLAYKFNNSLIFSTDDITQFQLKPIFQLTDYHRDVVSYAPIIYFDPTLIKPYLNVDSHSFTDYIIDFDNSPTIPDITDPTINISNPTNYRKLNYSFDGNTWHQVDMPLNSTPGVFGSEYNYTGTIPAASESTVVKYYFEAYDGLDSLTGNKHNRVTSPPSLEGAGQNDPPVTTYSYTVDGTSPTISLTTNLDAFSPNTDGNQDSLNISIALQDLEPDLNYLSLKIINSSNVEIFTWAPSIDVLVNNTNNFVWNGINNTGSLVTEGNYSIIAESQDRALNTGTFTKTILVDYSQPSTPNLSIDTTLSLLTPSNYPVFTSNDTNIIFESNSTDVWSNYLIMNLIVKNVGNTPFNNGSSILLKNYTRPISPGSPNTQSFTWNGKDDIEQYIPDGDYTASITATDAAGNISTVSPPANFHVERTASYISSLTADNFVFDPDGSNNTVTISYILNKSANTTINIINSLNQIVKTKIFTLPNDGDSYTWDGTGLDALTQEPDGLYTARLETLDEFGNASDKTILIIKKQIPAKILFPTSWFPVTGTLIVKGTAIDPKIDDSVDFGHYELWYRSGGSIVFAPATQNDPDNPDTVYWKKITVPISQQKTDIVSEYPISNISYLPVMNSILGIWDTSSLLTGTYTILLVSKDNPISPAVPHSSYDSVEVNVDNSIIDTTLPDLTITNPTSSNPNVEFSSGSGSLNISYILTFPSPGTPVDLVLDVVKMNNGVQGEVVYHRIYTNIVNGTNSSINSSLTWDGKNTPGTSYVDSGDYQILLTAMDTDGTGIKQSHTDITVQNLMNTGVQILNLSASPDNLLVNNSTTISYKVSQNSTVNIEIFDNNGISVDKLLTNGSINTTSHTVSWNGSASQGLFQCKMNVLSGNGTVAESVIPLLVSLGTGGTTANITSPNNNEILKGETKLNWAAHAQGKYYTPQPFLATIQVNGKINNYAPGFTKQLMYGTNVTAVESWTDDIFLKYTSVGMESFKRDNSTNIFCAKNGTRFLCSKFPFAYKGVDTYWVQTTVQYKDFGVNEFDTLPVLQVFTEGDYNQGLGKPSDIVIVNQSTTGFTAKTWIIGQVRDYYSAAKIGNNFPAQNVWDLKFHWSASGKVTTTQSRTQKFTWNHTYGISDEYLTQSFTFVPSIAKAKFITPAEFVDPYPSSDGVQNPVFGTSPDLDNNDNFSTTASTANPPIPAGDLPTTSFNCSRTFLIQKIAVPTPVNWSANFVLDSTQTSQWETPFDSNFECYKHHGLTSKDMSDKFATPTPSLNSEFAGFDSVKYTVIGINNTLVTPTITTNGKLLVSTNQESTWESNMDQNLLLKDGNIVQNGINFNIMADQNNPDPNYFIARMPNLSYASAYLNPDMSALNAVKDMYTFWGNPLAINNPYVGIRSDLGDWSVDLKYLDKTQSDKSFEINLLQTKSQNLNNYPGGAPYDLDDIFTINLKNNSLPQRFVTIKGSTSNLNTDGFVGYSMFYSKQGSGIWNSIPCASPKPVINGDLAHWNVTNLNGLYTIKLVVIDAGGVVESTKDVQIGTLASATSQTIVTAPCNKAYLTIPANALSMDTLITISPEKVEDSGLNLGPNMPQPIGVIYKLSPSNQTFNTDHLPSLSVRLMPDELSGLDTNALSIYQVEDGGQLNLLTSVQAISEVSSDENHVPIKRLNFTISHFSEFVILPKIDAPKINNNETDVIYNVITIHGTAEPSSIVEVFNNGVSFGVCTADSMGNFNKIVNLIIGQNNINATATRKIGNGSQTSINSNTKSIHYMYGNTPTSTPTITPTSTLTITPTVTITSTPSITDTMTPTATSTFTMTETQTFTATITMTATMTATINIILQFKSEDNNIMSNAPHPCFRLINVGTRQIDLSKVEIRYWYEYEGSNQSEVGVIDWAGKMPAGTPITNYSHISVINQIAATQNRYLSFIFDDAAGAIAENDFVDITARFNKDNWTAYDQSNDWSFINYNVFQNWDKVTIYYEGLLVWGIEPQMPANTSTQTPTTTATQTISSTCTPTATETYTITISPTSTNTPTYTSTPTVGPFEKLVSGNGMDVAKSICKAQDGGYMIAGYTNSYGAGQHDACIVKVDINGDNAIWKTFGDALDDSAESIINTTDGGYVIVGFTTDSNTYIQKLYLIKTDSAGNEQWSKKIGGPNPEHGYAVKQFSDGGFIITGSSMDTAAGGGVYLIRTDESGNVTWQKNLPGVDGRGIEILSDGYLIAGTKHSNETQDDFCVIKVNFDGDVIWSNSYGGNNNEKAYSMIKSVDNSGFIIVGYTNSYGAGNYDLYAVKINNQGILLWEKTYGGGGNDRGYSITSAGNNEYMITGETSSYGYGYSDMYILKINEIGQNMGTKTFGGTNLDHGYYIIKDGDDNGNYYVSVGDSQSYQANYNPHMFIVKDVIFKDSFLPDFSPSITPTQVATQLVSQAWPQAGHDSKHTNKSEYSANVTETNLTTYTDFYLPAPIGNINIDNDNYLYFQTVEENDSRIFKLDQYGNVVYVMVVNGPYYPMSTASLTMGLNNHLYYFENNLEFVGLKALNTDTFNNDWEMSGFLPSSAILVNGNDNLFYCTVDDGIRMTKDKGMSFTEMWQRQERGISMGFGHFGYDLIVDNDKNTYFTEPVTVSNDGYSSSFEGSKIVKYNSNGIRETEEFDASSYGYITKILINDDKSLIYLGISSNDGDKCIVLDKMLNKIDEFSLNGGNVAGMALRGNSSNLSFVGGSNNNNIYQYNNATSPSPVGSIIKLFGPITDSITTDIVTDAQGKIIFGTNNNMFVLLNPGNIKSTNSIQGSKSDIAIAANSNIYFVNDNNIMHIGNSTSIPVPPTAPVKPLLIANVQSNGVVLTCSTDNPNITGYNFYRDDNPYELLNSDGPVMSYIDTSVTANVAFTYIATGIDNYDQESDPSDPVTLLFGTPTGTCTFIATSTPTLTLTLTITETMTETCSNTDTPTASLTYSSTPTITKTLSNTVTPSLTITVTDTVSPTETNTDTATLTFSPTKTVTNTITETVSKTSTDTNTPTKTVTLTDTFTFSATQTTTVTSTFTSTGTSTVSSTLTGTITASDTATPTYSRTATITNTVSPTFTRTQSITVSPSGTSTATSTNSATITMTFSKTFTPSTTITAVSTPSFTPTVSLSLIRNVTVIGGCYVPGQTITVSFDVSINNAPSHGIYGDVVFSSDSNCSFNDDCVWDSGSVENPPVIVGHNGGLLYNCTDNNWHNVSLQVTVPQTYSGQYYVFVNVGQDFEQLFNWGSHIDSTGSATMMACNYTPTITSTKTKTPTITATITPTGTSTVTQTKTKTITQTITRTVTQTATPTGTRTISVTITKTFTISPTGTKTWTRSATPTITKTYTKSPTPTITVTSTVSGQQMMAELNNKETQTPTNENFDFNEVTTYNYPNPFNEETNIRFILKNPTEVNVRVYNANNNLVWKKNMQPPISKAGLNTLVWNGINDNGVQVASGVYILEIQTKNKVVRKKMALIQGAE